MYAEFIIPGEPVGKGRPRVVRNKYTGNSVAYTPEKTANYEELVKTMYVAGVNPRFPDDAMLRVEINAYFSIPKSASKKKRADMIGRVLRPIKKPDVDNIVKILLDSLNRIAYRDDSQVVSVIFNKWYSEEPRVEVKITEVSGEHARSASVGKHTNRYYIRRFFGK